MEIMGELTRIKPHQSSTPIVRRVATGPSNFHDLIPWLTVPTVPNSICDKVKMDHDLAESGEEGWGLESE